MSVSTIFDIAQTKVSSADASTKKKETEQNAAVSFSSVLNQPALTKQTDGAVGKSSEDKIQTGQEPATEAYDRYQYRDTKVAERMPETISDKVNSAKDELEVFKDELVQLVAGQFDVQPDDVENVLKELGMTAFDLMNPQNLAQLVVQLTDVQDRMELLMDSDFQNLLVQIGESGSELMNRLNLQMSQMDELISQMEVLDEPVEISVMQEPVEEMKQGSVVAEDDSMADEAEGMTESQDDVRQAAFHTVKKEAFAEDNNEQMSQNGQEHFNERPFEQNAFVQDGAIAEHMVSETELPPEQTTYRNTVDAMELIRQVAEQARVVLADDVTTMELQLNPENLGKLYLNVSTREGNVNAQITTQNELVKEALELQLATLRENLNQAGIRVDEIEVTVASHEFERNLEQNQEQNPQENSSGEQAKNGVRKNIRMDSLDELSGLMTEEEQLVAQIMKDNGNSIDFTA